MSYARTDEHEATTVEVTMPETGSPAGARVIAWRRRPGEPVDAGEPLCVVAWDGNTAEIDSPASGVLRMLAVGAGHRADTGATLALIDTAVRVPEREPEPEPPTEDDAVAEVVEAEADAEPESEEPEPEPELAAAEESEPETAAVIEVEPEPIEVEPEPPPPAPDPEAVLAEAERMLDATEEVSAADDELDRAPEPESEPAPEREPEPGPEPEPEPEPEPAPPALSVPTALLRDAPVRSAPAVELGRFLSPAVRRFVREHDVDPAAIEGSGRDGRVTLADIRDAT